MKDRLFLRLTSTIQDTFRSPTLLTIDTGHRRWNTLPAGSKSALSPTIIPNPVRRWSEVSVGTAGVQWRSAQM